MTDTPTIKEMTNAVTRFHHQYKPTRFDPNTFQCVSRALHDKYGAETLRDIPEDERTDFVADLCLLLLPTPTRTQ